MSGNEPSVPGSRGEVEDFLRKLASVPAAPHRGRLIFAMDATASRERTWREASRIQEEMFLEAGRLGKLEVQLVFYRGMDECKASRWLADAASLLAAMRKVDCAGGRTQIARVLRHARAETTRGRVNALVFVGDSMEEDAGEMCRGAGELGVLGVPIFLFHEGQDEAAKRVFAEMARLSGGACCHFDAESPQTLRTLLGAVAAFATGGRRALADYGRRAGDIVLQLTHQMGKR